MPSASMRLDRVRVQFTDSLTRGELRTLAADSDIRVLQTCTPIKHRTWQLLNDAFFASRPDVTLRVFGHYSQVCDLAFTARMTNVRHLRADSLMDAVGVEQIAAMEALESLGVGIFNLEGFEFLDQVTRGLKKLYLFRTRSRRPDLSPLRRFEHLEELYVEGQQKSIDVLSQLKNLQDVTLRSISTPDIRYLKALDRMWSLDIKLGGIRDLSAIEGMENIKYLELWQIRGLSDMSVISSLTGLQYLFLESLRRVAVLPALHRLEQLRRIVLLNMNGLQNLDSLEFAPALEECFLGSVRSLQPEECLPLLRNPNLRRAFGGFGSLKKNKRFEELLRERDIEPARGLGTGDFDFK